MAITVNGVTGSITDAEWAQMWQDAMDGGREEYVPTGLQVSPSSGRVLAVSAGRAFQSGASVVYTGGSTVTLGANAASAPRIDTVCMQVNWAGTESTAGSLVVVQGVAAANPVPRGLTKTPGGIWQTPLAYVTVAPAASTISASSIVDARPGANDGTFVACSVQGGWVQGSPQLGVIRMGNVVELAGRIQLTGGNQTPGGVALFGNAPLIPAGYRPKRTAAAVMATSDNDASMSLHRLLFLNDGTCTCTTILGTLPTGGSMRVQTTHWLGE